ncbi:embryonic protein UVS.2-like [Dendropsophus ebraccatus]|uniref:embryonic protein UVS.2-like n=1 Tax=Dendropsophus ebraccatus TaxID=150705 RepID=UPI003831CDCD
MNCVYTIMAPVGVRIILTIGDFHTEDGRFCQNDFLNIQDGSTRIGPFCGDDIIPVITSNTNFLQLTVVSDESVQAKGFEASYTFVPDVKDAKKHDANLGKRIISNTERCGGTFHTSEGTFTSPNYPNAYGPNLNCVYTITAPVDMRIILTISDFHMEDGRFCLYDYLKIQDGSTGIGSFCGDEIMSVITSTTNSLKLTFVSDESVQATGFEASYTFE